MFNSTNNETKIIDKKLVDCENDYFNNSEISDDDKCLLDYIKETKEKVIRLKSRKRKKTRKNKIEDSVRVTGNVNDFKTNLMLKELFTQKEKTFYTGL